MALEFIDGVTHYASDDIELKWSEAVQVSVVDTEPRRAGSKSFYSTEGASNLVSKYLPESAFKILGFAFKSGFPKFTVALLKGDDIQLWLTLVLSGGYRLLQVKRYPSTLLAEMDVTGLILADQWWHVEFGALISDTVGTCEVRLNGIELPQLTMSGVDTLNVSGGIDRVKLYMDRIRMTDIHVDNSTWRGDCIVETCYPTGVGNQATWIPSAGANWQNVDDDGDVDGDSTYNQTQIQGNRDSFAAGNVDPRPLSTIHAVAIHQVARKDYAGGRVVKPLVRVGGTDYVHTAEGHLLSDVYTGAQRIWETNPDTGLGWTESGINGAEIGYELSTAT